MPARRLLIFNLALGAALMWISISQLAAGQRKTPAPAQDRTALVPLEGAKIFRSYCAACHGANGTGDGPVAAVLKTRVPDLTAIARRNRGEFPAARIRSVIAGDEDHAAHGSRTMPIWGPIFHQIEDDQDMGYVRLENVVEYLKSIQHK